MTDDPYKPPAQLPGTGKPKWSYAFLDPSPPTTALRVLLWMGVAVAVVAMISDLMQLQLLGDRMAGRSVSDAEWDSNDARQGMIGTAQAALLVVSLVVWLRWLYMANSNAHVVASGRLKFTPGWAVAWYFVPIWCLWKPFQVMMEIWQASQEGAKYHRPSGLLVVWWVLWLAFNMSSVVVGRLVLSRPQAATLIDLVSQLLQVGLCIVAVMMVTGIYRMQLETLARHKAAAKEAADAATDQGEQQPAAS